jgi:hypothetical protein
MIIVLVGWYKVLLPECSHAALNMFCFVKVVWLWVMAGLTIAKQ